MGGCNRTKMGVEPGRLDITTLDVKAFEILDYLRYLTTK